jgi:hypothetical protein
LPKRDTMLTLELDYKDLYASKVQFYKNWFRPNYNFSDKLLPLNFHPKTTDKYMFEPFLTKLLFLGKICREKTFL